MEEKAETPSKNGNQGDAKKTHLHMGVLGMMEQPTAQVGDRNWPFICCKEESFLFPGERKWREQAGE